MNTNVYLEQFSAFYETWNVSSDKKTMLFVSSIGYNLYSLLRDLLAPTSVKDCTFEVITNLKITLIRNKRHCERFKFH